MIFFLFIIKKGSKSRIQELLLTSSRPTRCLHLKYSWYLYNTCWIHINLIPNKSGFVESNNWEMDVIVCCFVLGIYEWAAMKALLCLCLGDRIVEWNAVWGYCVEGTSISKVFSKLNWLWIQISVEIARVFNFQW